MQGGVTGRGAAKQRGQMVRSSKIAEVPSKLDKAESIRHSNVCRLLSSLLVLWKAGGAVMRKEFHSILFDFVGIVVGLGLLYVPTCRRWRVSVSVTDGYFHPIVHVHSRRPFPSN